MSSSSETPDPDPPDLRGNRDGIYWMTAFHELGMAMAQAELLAFGPDVDRHAVREALERGCRPEMAFRIWAP